MYNKITYILCSLIITAVLFTSCVNKGGGEFDKTAEVDFIYSEFLNVYPSEDYTAISIVNPWDTSKILQKYILVDRNEPLPESLPDGTVIPVPVEKIIVYSSVHISILEELGVDDRIVGVCDLPYITSPKIKEKAAAGKVIDCGNSMNPNVERIAESGGEIIIASPFENSSYGAVEKLKIPILEAADYTETYPLGRCEWIKLFGYILDCEEKADSLFRVTERRYNELKDKVAGQLEASGAERPTLLVERKYSNSWSLPGGNSYTGIMYKDAGADYIFDGLDSKGNVQKSFETILQKGIHADYWLFKYSMDRTMTYDDLRNEYLLYENFDAFKNHRIYGCNTLENSYYEDITLHPDRILEDLVSIFHPEILPGHEPEYFRPLQISRKQ